MTARFEPPTVDDVPSVAADTRKTNPIAWSLFRHYGPRGPRGRTVIKQANGAYITVDIASPQQVADALAVYVGGHIYTVSTAEQAELDAAGFGDRLTPLGDDTPVTPSRRYYPAADLYPSTTLYPGVP